METLTEFSVRNGNLLETYSVERDVAGDVFIRNVLDGEEGEPVDIMHIDPQALRPIAAALLAAARGVPEINGPVVVQFPMRKTATLEVVGRVQ